MEIKKKVNKKKVNNRNRVVILYSTMMGLWLLAPPIVFIGGVCKKRVKK